MVWGLDSITNALYIDSISSSFSLSGVGQQSKNVSLQVIFYTVAQIWFIITNVLFPAIQILVSQSTPTTYSSLRKLVVAIYDFIKSQAPVLWTYFVCICSCIWYQFTRIAPGVWLFIISNLNTSWLHLTSTAGEGYLCFRKKMLPVIYDDSVKALNAVIEDCILGFWYILPDLRKGLRRVTIDCLVGYTHAITTLKKVRPEIRYDLFFRLPRTIVADVVGAFQILVLDTTKKVKDNTLSWAQSRLVDRVLANVRGARGYLKRLKARGILNSSKEIETL